MMRAFPLSTLHRFRVAACVLLLAALPTTLWAIGFEDGLRKLAAEMQGGAELAQSGRNVAIVQFAPAGGEERRLGDHLMRKVRIHMFDADTQRRLRFVSQGQVLKILVEQGIKTQSVIFDERQRIKLGRLLTADMLVHGTYEVLGGSRVEVVSFLVDVASGVTLAQSVQTLDNVPGRLLIPANAPAPVATYSPIGNRRYASDAEASKRYRMAGVFAERGKPERARQLYEDVIARFPTAVEAVYAQLQLMRQDLVQLRADREYNEDFYQVIATLPANYRKLSLYRSLKEDTVAWLLELARYEVGAGEGPGDGVVYFERAQRLGLSGEESTRVDDELRAARVRAEMRQGSRENAELMLVEWEVERPDSRLRKRVQKEFERKANMVTIDGGVIVGRTVDPFNIDIYETTNREFLEFVRANPDYRKSAMTLSRNDSDYLRRWRGDLTVPEELLDVPVVFVSALVAEDYCKWRGKRLPNSYEWSVAAGEGRRKYPWGDREPNKNIANYNRGMLGEPLPGESHPLGATPEGVMHMGGNVWESTTTRQGDEIVARGGSYYDGAQILRNGNRDLSGDPPTYSSRFMGFRCVQ